MVWFNVFSTHEHANETKLFRYSYTPLLKQTHPKNKKELS
nr:MAG TPA: hypothetical protein [Caudoviricetes sp.]